MSGTCPCCGGIIPFGGHPSCGGGGGVGFPPSEPLSALIGKLDRDYVLIPKKPTPGALDRALTAFRNTHKPFLDRDTVDYKEALMAALQVLAEEHV